MFCVNQCVSPHMLFCKGVTLFKNVFSLNCIEQYEKMQNLFTFFFIYLSLKCIFLNLRWKNEIIHIIDLGYKMRNTGRPATTAWCIGTSPLSFHASWFMYYIIFEMSAAPLLIVYKTISHKILWFELMFEVAPACWPPQLETQEFTFIEGTEDWTWCWAQTPSAIFDEVTSPTGAQVWRGTDRQWHGEEVGQRLEIGCIYFFVCLFSSTLGGSIRAVIAAMIHSKSIYGYGFALHRTTYTIHNPFDMSKLLFCFFVSCRQVPNWRTGIWTPSLRILPPTNPTVRNSSTQSLVRTPGREAL